MLLRSNFSEVGIPALSTGDGICLFNSMSTALTGDENLAPELRLRTAIEMSLNPKQYTLREDFHELLSCSTSYEESLMAAATDGAYMSVWNMIALSTVVGNPVQSVYPAMNGEKDKIPLYLNKVFSTEENQHRETISIMWSRLVPADVQHGHPIILCPFLRKLIKMRRNNVKCLICEIRLVQYEI